MPPKRKDPGPIVAPVITRPTRPKAKGQASGRGRQAAPAFGLDRLVPTITDPIADSVKEREKRGHDPRVITQGANDPSEILRRQRLLKANGYTMAVDGIWGPRSQQAWTDYTTRGNQAPFKPEGRGPQITVNRNPETPEMMQAARLEKERAAERAMFEQQVASAAEVIKRANVLKKTPAAARTLKFREVAEAILDPKTGMGLHTRKGATAFQEWAVANKVPGVTVTGKYDRPTHDLMTRELKRMEAAEKRVRVRAVLRDLYAPAGIKGGDKVSWLPGVDTVPTAAELDAMIQGEGTGFKASQILAALVQRSTTSGAVFDPMRRAYLMKQAAIFQPFGKALQPSWLRNSGGTGGTQLQYIAEILGIQVMAPTGDLSAFSEKGAARYLEGSIYANREWSEDNARLVRGLHAEIQALTSSTTPEEFATKLAAYTFKEAKRFEEYQKKLAATNGSWWGKAIDQALRPGKYVRASLVYNAMLLDHELPRLSPFFDQLASPEEADKKRPSWEDAQAYLGDAPEDYTGTQDPASLWVRLPLELVVDPLNAAHPFRAVSTMMYASTRAMSNVGLAGKMAGSALGRYHFVGGGPFGRALTYDKGTWSKAAVLGTVTDSLLTSSAGTALHRTAGFQRAAGMLSRSVALRSEAFRNVRARVEANVRHGFTTPRGMVGKLDLDWEVRTPRSTHTRTLLVESMEDRKSYIMETPELAQIVNDLSDSGSSLYVHAANPERSNVGQALYTNMVEKARIGGLHQAATKEAHRVHQDFMDAAGVDPTDYAAYQAAEEEAAELALAEYNKIILSSGNFLAGGFLTGRADKAVMLRVKRHIGKQMDNVEALFPALQDLLEDAAERGGYSLWDEKGLWVNRQGDAANSLRTLARESFEEGNTVPQANPLHGIPFTKAERDELIADEVARGVGRLRGYQARQIAGELPSGKFDLRAEVDELEEKVRSHWKQEGGDWYDTRPTVEVSDLYTRHTADAFRANAKGELVFRGRGHTGAEDGTAMSRLAQLADAPANSAGGATDDALWQLTWDMGSMYKMRLPGSVSNATAGRRYLGPDSGDFENFDDYLRAVAEQHAHGERLRRALTKTHHANGRAWDEALSKELRKEGAIWQALAHSENQFAKLAYLGLKGTLNTWIFATLALRPGWMVRNVIDNVAKLMVMGVRDPRMFFLGAENPGSAVASIFDMGLVPIRQMIAYLDRLFGTRGLEHWMRLEELIWTQSADALGSIFASHGVHVPAQVIEGARFQVFEDGRSQSLKGPQPNADDAIDDGLMRESNKLELAGDELARIYKDFRNGAFELMGNRPENYFKRVLYRDEYMKQMDQLREMHPQMGEIALEQHAFKAAWAKVEETLFDYSKVSVTEDNFRVFFPFIQFWRKNSAFWMSAAVSKPWLPLGVVKVDEERREAHADLPDWLKRYIHVDELADAAAVVPGLDVIVKYLIPQDVAYDPFNLLSFAPLYRSLPQIMDELGAQVGMEKGLSDRLKTKNPSLPSENEGHAIFGPMIDAISDWGLGLSPFVRKPLEYDTPGIGNIATERAWQTMFPQTSVAMALTRQFWGDSAALKVGGWESLWGMLPLGVKTDAIADQFDYFTQQFVAEQVSRGEEPDVEAAKKAVRHWFLTQNLYGYFTGLYLRTAKPEDALLAKLAEADKDDVPEDQREALKLWRMRGADRLTFERYVAMAPLIEAYYRSSDWQTKVQMKRDHPELIQYVDASWRGRPFSGKWARNATKYTQQAKFYAALNIVESVDAPYDVQQAALDMFRTPELEAYWQEAQTPKKERVEMVRAAAFEYHSDLSQGYFEIPDDDYEARDGYIAEHPELVRYWNKNNSASDDYDAMIGGANAALRSIYFETVKANGGGNAGFAAAASFLKDFRFMFEDTDSAHKINMETGTWEMGVGGGGKFSAERLADYQAAKPHMSWFFDTYMKKVGEKAAWAWLETADGLPAKLIREYLKKWGKQSQKSIDYMRAKGWLTLYFSMPEAERQKWLNSGAEGAKVVREYFAKYSSGKGNTQHSRDYLAAKSQLEAYFALPKAQRDAWLNGGSAEARIVKAYFKKYGKVNRYARAFLNKFPQLDGGTPEQRKRLEFWRLYFTLTPDKRPAFVLAQAEAHGIFMYGEIGEEERHDREMEYKRRAVGLGMNARQTAYLYARPLLDMYFSLPKNERALFQRLNPEVGEYIALYGKPKLTGDKTLDAAIEGYFKLPPDSFARSEWLRKHPKVQDWFDSKSSPAEAAMRNVLEQYFSLGGNEREEFVLKHPEIPAYFESRREQKSLEGDIYDAFDHSDPRLRQYFTDADDLLRAAEEMRRKLRMQALNKFRPDALETRRDRRPAVSL